MKTERTNVTDIFPVTFADPGSNPIKLLMKIKKNTVSKKKVYFLYLGPIFAFIISSLTKRINGSKNACIPFGATFLFL